MSADPFVRYGNVIVPFSALWSDEQVDKENQRTWWIRPCSTVENRLAIAAPNQQTGKPILSQSHPFRQRWLVKMEICDLCGCSLKLRTKVSVSDEMVRAVDGLQMPMVSEPLLCKGCAGIAIEQCPHLQRRLAAGELVVRQVAQYKRVAQVMKKESALELTGMALPGIICHVRMAITRFKVRDVDWLRKGEPL